MSKTLPTNLTDFSRYAAEQFLQTAVFVDDRIYAAASGAVVEPTILQTPGLERKVALKSAEQQSKASSDLAGAGEAEYSPHDILTSFAKTGIVCALYQPKKDASVGENSDAYQLCSASDIVIVDWDLYGDAGKKALELVGNLIHQSLTDVPEQLRLVLVYTKEANLEAISNEIFEKLTKLLPGQVEPTKEDKGLALHTPNTRVVILGKPSRRPAKYKAYEVPERDLAARAIVEFSKLASGLLQGAVLLGLAEIRGNHRKVLSKFDSSLDPAFLTHKALSFPDDASEHVLPLLIAEIQAALEDQLPNPLLSAALIEDWCSNRWVPQGHAKTASGAGDAKQIAKDLCLKGQASVKTIGIKGDKLYSYLQESLNSTANHRLAILMSQRTHYGKVSRSLKLGAILKSSNSKFYLCLQPICDAVRIPKTRRFLFVQLYEKAADTANKFNLVVFDGGSLIELFFQPKVFNCFVAEFRGTGADGSVMAAEKADGSFVFKPYGKRGEYKWLAQLKPEQAQRAAEQFARELSRVGLTESEWLRLMSR
jgi:hypothetical protein